MRGRRAIHCTKLTVHFRTQSWNVPVSIQGKVGRGARATSQRLQEGTAEAVRTTDQVIRQHPYESIGVGFGAGLVAGLLVSVLGAR